MKKRLVGVVTISTVMIYMGQAVYLEKSPWQAAALALVWHS
jgi:hypothetical protein